MEFLQRMREEQKEKIELGEFRIKEKIAKTLTVNEVKQLVMWTGVNDIYFDSRTKEIVVSFFKNFEEYKIKSWMPYGVYI